MNRPRSLNLANGLPILSAHLSFRALQSLQELGIEFLLGFSPPGVAA
jgi:hypothetical protein